MPVADLRAEVRDRVTYVVERFLARGAGYRLLFIAGLLGLMSVAGGGVVLLLDGGFDQPGEAFWWAFLRLSDPGYLGDDTGRVQVVVATALTVLGYVVFVGALVATMTQWLNATLARMELGLTPVRFRGHVAILGWTERTPAIVREMLGSEGRLARWLQALGARHLRVVILAEPDRGHPREELLQELPRLAGRVVMRSGSPLRLRDLERVAASHSAAVVVPGSDAPYDGHASQDARTVKSLLALAELCRRHEIEDLPAFVGELYDPRTAETVLSAYPGRCELVATEPLVGRVLAASAAEPGLAAVVELLLGQGTGVAVRIVDDHPHDGVPWSEVTLARRSAIPMGFVRSVAGPARDEIVLNPALDRIVRQDDRIIVLTGDGAAMLEPLPRESVVTPLGPVKEILVLGWNRKAPRMLEELHVRLGAGIRVRALSTRSAESRRQTVVDDGAAVPDGWVEHLVGDYSAAAVLGREMVGDADRIILLASDVLSSGQEADARTMATLLHLSHRLGPRRPHIVAELHDASGVDLVRRYADDVLVSPRIAADFLGQVVLRRELHGIFADLVGGGGLDLRLVSATELGAVGRSMTYETLSALGRDRQAVVLGVSLRSDAGPRLLPSPSDRFDLTDEDSIVLVR